MKRGCLIFVLVLFLIVCLALALAGWFWFTTQPTKPMIQISSPRDGERIQWGQTTHIQAMARDNQKIRRVELWIDGALHDAQNSTVPGGVSPFPVTLNWQPTTPGAHTIIVRAFNPRGGHAQGIVTIEAIQSADRDNDRVPDTTDLCPDQPGTVAAQGCPDRDSDGIRDSDDACPDQPGLPGGRGCPAPSMGDRDGDGLLDDADDCPDQPGSPFVRGCPDADNDGVRDSEDRCPREAGPQSNNGCPVPNDADADGVPDASDACPHDSGTAGMGGCPDSDGDGVTDASDACPGVPGSPSSSGCPDRDNDGMRDLNDLCPDVPGPASNAGCPPTGAGDSDHDGVDDGTDLAPDEAGSSDSGGAPAPGSDEVAPEDPLDQLGDALPGPRLSGVTFEALDFQVFQDYSDVYCYGGLGGSIGVVEHFGPFQTLGARHWDIAEYLGGENSRFITLETGTPVQGFLECVGYVSSTWPGGGTVDVPFNLGSIRINQPEANWNSAPISQDSSGGLSGHSFRATYRLCRGACRESAIVPPVIHFYHVGNRHRVVWTWEGNRLAIDGFRLYLGNTHLQIRASQSSFWLPDYMIVACGERLGIRITAFRGADESAFSNTQYWSGGDCPRHIALVFQQLETRELGGESSPVGPVTGIMWANNETLRFDASDLSYFGTFNGLWLESNHTYDILNLLQIIARWEDSCIGRGCPSYSAPWNNTVLVTLGEHEDLSVGIHINDVDKYWGGVPFGYQESTQTACDARNIIPASQVTSGIYRVPGSGCNLTIRIETVDAVSPRP